MICKIIKTEVGWWSKLQVNMEEDKARFREEMILSYIRKGMTWEQAIHTLNFNAQKSVRRFDCDMKPWKPAKDFNYKMSRLSPELVNYLSEKPKYIPKGTTAAYKRVSPEVKAKREAMKSLLLSQGIEEKDVEKMIRTIKEV